MKYLLGKLSKSLSNCSVSYYCSILSVSYVFHFFQWIHLELFMRCRISYNRNLFFVKQLYGLNKKFLRAIYCWPWGKTFRKYWTAVMHVVKVYWWYWTVVMHMAEAYWWYWTVVMHMVKVYWWYTSYLGTRRFFKTIYREN